MFSHFLLATIYKGCHSTGKRCTVAISLLFKSCFIEICNKPVCLTVLMCRGCVWRMLSFLLSRCFCLYPPWCWRIFICICIFLNISNPPPHPLPSFGSCTWPLQVVCCKGRRAASAHSPAWPGMLVATSMPWSQTQSCVAPGALFVWLSSFHFSA